jgi:hypothetical protein
VVAALPLALVVLHMTIHGSLAGEDGAASWACRFGCLAGLFANVSQQVAVSGKRPPIAAVIPASGLLWRVYNPHGICMRHRRIDCSWLEVWAAVSGSVTRMVAVRDTSVASLIAIVAVCLRSVRERVVNRSVAIAGCRTGHHWREWIAGRIAVAFRIWLRVC